MQALRRILSTPVAIVLAAFMLSVSILVGSFSGASGDSHDQTYYACLYAGSLTQVNTTAPPANCGRGIQIQWSSFGGSIDGSIIEAGTIPGSALEDGTITHAKLSDGVREDLRCGAFPHLGVDWSGCDLSNANLTGAFLGNANLTGTYLFEANLTNANLRFANLSDANLLLANLTNADLRDTNMTDAILSEANLTNANLTDALLTGANLTFVTWNNTICPDGTNSNDNGNTCINNL